MEAVNATLDVIIPDMSEAIQQSGNVTDTIVAVRGGGIRRRTNINLSKFNSHKNVSYIPGLCLISLNHKE